MFDPGVLQAVVMICSAVQKVMRMRMRMRMGMKKSNGAIENDLSSFLQYS